jgi:hypothetical protein
VAKEEAALAVRHAANRESFPPEQWLELDLPLSRLNLEPELPQDVLAEVADWQVVVKHEIGVECLYRTEFHRIL